MRYILQLWAMLTDILIMGCACYIIWSGPTGFLNWALVIFTLYTWKENGGLMAWRPKNIRKFMENARKQGL